GLVVAVQAVAVQFQEAVADPPDVVERGWPLRMPGDLRALPGGETGVDLRLELVELRAELAEIVLHAGPTLARGGQLLDLLFDLRDGLLEVKVFAHAAARLVEGNRALADEGFDVADELGARQDAQGRADRDHGIGMDGEREREIDRARAGMAVEHVPELAQRSGRRGLRGDADRDAGHALRLEAGRGREVGRLAPGGLM